VREALGAVGFDPQPEKAPPRLRLRNCPFHDVVDVAPHLVCGLNQRLVSGVLDGLGVSDRCSAQPDGVPPDCCVTVHTG
jgi:predicted ArsR family transcriptional regulator